MRAFVVACLLLAGAASVHGQGYVASVAYMKSKVLPGGVSYIAAANRTALLTIAELDQNVTTQATTLNWELSFDPDPTKPVPVKLEIVAYRPSQDPSNRDVILTLASNPAGLQLDTVDTIGMFKLPALNAARVSAGLGNITVCDPKNPCEPGPGAMVKFSDDMIYVMTYADGTVVAGFMKNNPEIEYPEPDDDHFYVAEVYANTSFALGGAPLYAVGKDVVTLAVYDNFDNARTWSVNLYTTLTAGARLTAVKLVSLVGSTPVTVLDLGSAIDFASPDIADFGFLNENAFTSAKLYAGMAAAKLPAVAEILSATTVTAGGITYTNYAKFEPVWNQPSAAPSPPPVRRSPPPKRRSPPPKRRSPPPKRRSPPPKKRAPPPKKTGRKMV